MVGMQISAIDQAIAPCAERGGITASIAKSNPMISEMTSTAAKEIGRAVSEMRVGCIFLGVFVALCWETEPDSRLVRAVAGVRDAPADASVLHRLRLRSDARTGQDDGQYPNHSGHDPLIPRRCQRQHPQRAEDISPHGARLHEPPRRGRPTLQLKFPKLTARRLPRSSRQAQSGFSAKPVGRARRQSQRRALQ